MRARPGGCERPRRGSRAQTRPESGSRRRGSRPRASAAARGGRRRSPRSRCRPRPLRSEAEAAVGEVVERYVATHVPVAVYQAPDRHQDRIGLVDDLAHDLLDDVLDGDDSGRCGRIRRPPRPSRSAAAGCPPAGRRAAWSPGTIGTSRTTGSTGASGLSVMSDLASAFACTIPRTRSGLSSSITSSRVCPEVTHLRSADSTVSSTFDGHHCRDRRHHLAGLLLVQVEDAAEHLCLALVEVGRRAPRAIICLSSSALSDLQVPLHLDAQDARDHEVGRTVQDPDHRAENDPKPLERDRRPLEHPLRVA